MGAAGFASAVLLAITPGVAGAAGWLAPTSVNGAADLNQTVGMDGAGNTIVAWQTGSSPSAIQGAKHVVGSIGFPALPDFSSDALHDNQVPVIAMSRAGNGLVAWVHSTAVPGAQEIEIASVKSDGSLTKPVETINTSGGTDTDVTAAINESGAAVVAWRNGGSTVQVTTRPDLASAFNAAHPFVSTAVSAPSAAIDGAGNSIVVWPFSAVNKEIAAARHAAPDPNNTWTTDAALAISGHDLDLPAVAANPNGQMVIAFQDANSGQTKVSAVGGTVSGGSAGSAAITPVSGVGVNHGPGVTMVDAGGAAVGWTVGNAIQMSLRPPSGSFPPPAQVKSVPSLSTPDNFTLAGNGQGELIAAWYENDLATGKNVVRTWIKPTGSSSFGAPQTVSDPTTDSTLPVLAIDQTGDAIAVFKLGNNPSEPLAAAFYDTTPPTVGAISGPSTGTTGSAVTFSIPQPTDAFAASPTIAWNLGDGSATATGTTVTHTFSAPGAYTVTVTVSDTAANTTTVTKVITVTKASTPPPPPPPPPAKTCVVPKLKGTTLSRAAAALRKANCALGKVSRPKKPKHRKLRALIVSRSNPGAGSVRANGTKVALTLVEKPKPKPKHKKHK